MRPQATLCFFFGHSESRPGWLGVDVVALPCAIPDANHVLLMREDAEVSFIAFIVAGSTKKPRRGQDFFLK